MFHKLDKHGAEHSLNDQKLWVSKVNLPVCSNSHRRLIISLLTFYKNREKWIAHQRNLRI